MFLSFSFEIDKLENTIGFDFYLPNGKAIRLVKLLKYQFKQHKDFLERIKDIESQKNIEITSLEKLEKEFGIRKSKKLEESMHISFQFDYANLIMPWKYNWVVFRFTEFLIEKDTLSLTLLGVGLTIEKY